MGGCRNQIDFCHVFERSSKKRENKKKGRCFVVVSVFESVSDGAAQWIMWIVPKFSGLGFLSLLLGSQVGNGLNYTTSSVYCFQ